MLQRTSTSILLSLAILSLAILCPSRTAALAISPQAIEDEEGARGYLEELLSGDADSLAPRYLHTDALLAALEAGGGFKALQLQLSSLGELIELGKPTVTALGEYTSYQFPSRFSRMDIGLILNVDAQGAIAGIVTGAYIAPEENASPDNSNEVSLDLPVEVYESVLPGTLTLPEGEGPFPALILVHGSGPNDRDETLLGNKPFRDLAQGLAELGIAVYRYDKRTYVFGPEMASDMSLTLKEETIEDAVNAFTLISSQEEIDKSRVFVLGHSLGGLALPFIAEEISSQGYQAGGYIFLAAPARSLPVLMKDQYSFLTSLDPEAVAQDELAEIYDALDRLIAGEPLKEGEMTLGASKAYWEDILSKDQLAKAEQMEAPCLLLQGEEDYQVTMEDYALWEEACRGKENWTLKSFPGLTHLFTPGSLYLGPQNYYTPGQVSQEVIDTIASWIMEH